MNRTTKSVDWQCIGIRKDYENKTYVDYFFESNVWGRDPRYEKRHMIIGQNRGLFRIEKEKRDVKLIYPMEGDEDQKRFNSSARKVIKESENGIYPETTMHACG